MSRHGNWSVRLLSIQKRVTKLIKRVEKISNRERSEKLGLITLLKRRMREDLTETFKIINGISNYGRHSLNISSQNANLLWRQILKTKSINQLDYFLLIRVI